MNDAYRQTGRTTRMVEQAVQAALRRHAIYIVVHDKSVPYVQGIVEKVWSVQGQGQVHGIKVEPLQEFSTFDWEKMRPLRAHPNCLFFVDHYLLERRIEACQRQAQELIQEASRLFPFTIV